MSAGTDKKMRRISDAFAMFVVMWVSMLCLLYVAYGEATRTFERFQGDKLAGQAKLVENAMESFLRSGLTLKQFIGFQGLGNQILESDETISSLVVTDADGETVFSAGDASWTGGLGSAGSDVQLPGRIVDSTVRDGVTFRDFNDQYIVMVPLDDKFEQVGRLYIAMPTAAVTDYVWAYFEWVVYGSFGPAVIFALIIAVYGRGFQTRSLPWAQISFAVIFIVSAAVVIAALVALYSEGAQAKAEALAQSLGQRLSPLVQYNLNLREIGGIDGVLREYLIVNPELSSAALTVDGRIVYHTDSALVGRPWTVDADHYQYVVDLAQSLSRNVQVAVELPSNVVTGEILRSVKNFGALFIASAFLANLFFQVGGAAVRRTTSEPLDASTSAPAQMGMIDYVKPVFFLGVLAEHMTYAFLPQHVREIALAAGVSEWLASAPFTLFYAAFALALIPAGYLAQRFSPRPLMYIGLLCAGAGLLITATTHDFWVMIAARVLSGVGQGMLFIGVQSYLLAVASERSKTQAAAVIVYGFQGGMISGMAVGSLLVGSMGEQGVFALGALIVVIAAVYSIVTVPRLSEAAQRRLSQDATASLLSSIGKAFGNRQFMSAMVTIGLPAKAVLTGVISFAMPLLLSQAAYAQEDIGQIIMIYALAVVAASQIVAPWVDRRGDSRVIIFYGAVLSGVGLVLVAAAGANVDPLAKAFGFSGASTALMVFGIGLVGVAHGFINAPVVTYIAGTELASRIGTGTATSTYRFLERIGHVAGPIVVAQLFFLFPNDWSAIGWAGVAIAIFGLIFIGSARTTSAPRSEAQHHSSPRPA